MRYLLLLFCLVIVTVCHGEGTSLLEGGVRGSISPNDVHITLTLKISEKEAKGENIKGSITLKNGGSFDFSDVPPGKYDLLFTLHDESRYDYLVDNWFGIIVKPGQVTKGLDYRLTSQDSSYLLDELVVEFSSNVPTEKALEYINQLNCHITREPLILRTSRYYLNIPDDKKVEELIEEFKRFPEVLSVRRTEVIPITRQPIEGKAKFELSEVFDNRSDEVLLNFKFETEKIYPCMNYRIKSHIKKQGALISLIAEEVLNGGMCLTAIGPAISSEKLLLPFGGYTIQFEYGNAKERYSLHLIEPSISVIGLDSSSKPSETTLWRRPDNSFAYLCGTTIKTSWICDDFIKLVRSTIDLKEIYFPNTGKRLYPLQSGGHYHDMPARYFIYNNEEDYEKVGKILENYNNSTISIKSGVGIELINWKDKHYRSWMFRRHKSTKPS